MIRKRNGMLIEFSVIVIVIVLLMQKSVWAKEQEPEECYIEITGEEGEVLSCENGETLYYNHAVAFRQIKESLYLIEYLIMEQDIEEQDIEEQDNGEQEAWEVLPPEGIKLPQEIVSDRRYLVKFRWATPISENVASHIFYECQVVIDVTKSKIELESDQDLSQWMKEVPNCTVTVLDEESGISRVNCYVNGSLIKNYHCEQENEMHPETKMKFSFELNEETSKQGGNILIEVCDLAGNENSYHTVYSLDLTAPLLSVTGVEQNHVYANDIVLKCMVEEFNFEGGFLVMSEEEQVPLTSSESFYEFTFDQEGAYMVELFSFDAAGNQSEKLAYSFVIDRTKPQVRMNGLTEGEFVNHEVEFDITVADSHVKVDVECYIEEGLKKGIYLEDSWYLEKGEQTKTYQLKEEGIYTISTVATDEAGNQSILEAHIGIDWTAPKTWIAGITDGVCINQNQAAICYVEEFFYQSNVIQLTGTFQENSSEASGVQMVSFKSTGILSSLGQNFTKEGVYELKLSARDLAKNEGSCQVKFTIDRTPPLIRTIKEFDGTYLTKFQLPDNVISYISDTSSFQYQVYLNDQIINAGQTIIKPGRYILRIEAEDAAGNRSRKNMQFIIRRNLDDAHISKNVISTNQCMPEQVLSDQNLKAQDHTKQSYFSILIGVIVVLTFKVCLCYTRLR